jgi:hypothetical protein
MGPDAGKVTSIHELAWIETRAVSNKPLVSSLLLELDPGEAEAIALSMETSANLLLIDERHGRKIAARFGVPVLGLLGVLIQAKREGFIKEAKPILDALISIAGFWISAPLYARVLETAGEKQE